MNKPINFYHMIIDHTVNYFKEMTNKEFAPILFKPIKENKYLSLLLLTRFKISMEKMEDIKFFERQLYGKYNVIVLFGTDLNISKIEVIDLMDKPTILIDMVYIFDNDDNTKFANTIYNICKVVCKEKEENFCDIDRNPIAKDIMDILHPEAITLTLLILKELDITTDIDYSEFGSNEEESKYFEAIIPNIYKELILEHTDFSTNKLELYELMYTGFHRDVIESECLKVYKEMFINNWIEGYKG